MDAFKNRSPFKRKNKTETGIEESSATARSSDEKHQLPAYDGEVVERRGSLAEYNISGVHDDTHRKLKARHIQLIGIGGTIGTALYVQIGRGLLNGGPASLFIAFTFWCSVVLAVTMCMAEMVTYLPISSPFIRFAGRYVDEAFGFAAGYNFFMLEAALCPFEIVACSVIIRYWSDVVPVGAIVAIVTVLYGAVNLISVKWYGEVEFWAALGKVILIIGLIFMTFIVMLGGNPLGDRFGFRYWNNPGAFKPLYYEGDLGYFLGFLQCLIQASFVIAGPDYVSMAAGEAENPRKVLPSAFKAVFYRLTTFFILGALCVGILVPSDDPEMLAAFTNNEPGAAASPYVVAMNRLRIGVFPHIVNALVLASAFSAGNSYLYCATRTLFGLALEGKAPKILTKTNKVGVPYNCVIVVLLICLLAFLQVSAGSAKVLGWFVSLITASQLINFAFVCFTYLMWYRALKAQGMDRKELPFRSMFQPWVAIYGLAWTAVMSIVGGYTVFLPGFWEPSTFVFSYFMVFLTPILFIGWKLVHRTKFRPLSPETIDLQGEVKEIEEYQRNFIPKPYKNWADKWFNKAFGG